MLEGHWDLHELSSHCTMHTTSVSVAWILEIRTLACGIMSQSNNRNNGLNKDKSVNQPVQGAVVLWPR